VKRSRTKAHTSVRECYALVVTTINSEEIRIPRRAREAVARHERVVVLNRERPVFAIVHPDDLPLPGVRRRGRSVGDIASDLAGAASPDSEFGDDMDAVLRSVGPMPGAPWEPS
jgi:hypothetical protein